MLAIKKYFRIVLSATIILFVFQFVLAACEDVIDVDVDNFEQRIVIDGAISDNTAGSRILISFTENAFRVSGSTKIYDANVTVTNDAGNSEILNEAEPGKYLFTSMYGEPGRKYSIKVECNGKEYNGVSTLNRPMEIDSIRFAAETSFTIWNIPFSYYKTKIYLENKKGIDEYCIIKINDSSNKINKATIVYQDKYAGDNPILLIDDNAQLEKNETINIELLTLDKSSYEYFFQLNELSEETGLDIPDILNVNTYNPNSNLSNGALGYFYAYSYKKYTAVVR